MKKHNQILVAVLVVQIALSAVLLWPRQAVSGGESEPLLGDLAVADVVALIVEDHDQNRMALSQEGDQWVLSELGAYPTDAAKVNQLLNKLVAINTGRLVTRTDSSHKRLQVARDDFLRRVELKTADGESVIVYLGSSPRYGATHVRLEGQDETYLTDDLGSWEANTSAAAWIDATYFYVVQDDIVSLTLENSNGSFTFSKDETDQWIMAGLAEDEELNVNNVASTVSQASRVSMSRPLGKVNESAYGLDDPQTVVSIQTAEGIATLEIGNQFVEDNSYVVKSSDSEYYVRVSEFAVQSLLDNTREDFLQLPPTPEAEESTP